MKLELLKRCIKVTVIYVPLRVYVSVEMRVQELTLILTFHSSSDHLVLTSAMAVWSVVFYYLLSSLLCSLSVIFLYCYKQVFFVFV